MSCENCTARQKLMREAYERAKLAKAAGHAAKGAAEMVGLKKKTGADELAAESKPKKRKTRRKADNPSGPAGSTPGQSGQEKHDG